MGTYDTISMTGKEVYKFATTKVPKVLQEAFANANVEADDIDWLVMHQANIRIMETISKKLGIPMDKVRSRRPAAPSCPPPAGDQNLGLTLNLTFKTT